VNASSKATGHLGQDYDSEPFDEPIFWIFSFEQIMKMTPIASQGLIQVFRDTTYQRTLKLRLEREVYDER